MRLQARRNPLSVPTLLLTSCGEWADPAEMIKTACQFSAKQGAPVSPLAVAATTFRERGIAGFYSGCAALVVGNSAKAGVRFLSYDAIKEALKDKETGKLSTSGSILAGMAAGACEATFAVTPSETVKTKLIDDARRSQPRFTGTANGVATILQEEGLAGMYRGLFPTIVKQSANSAVRFTCALAVPEVPARKGTIAPADKLDCRTLATA